MFQPVSVRIPESDTTTLHAVPLPVLDPHLTQALGGPLLLPMQSIVVPRGTAVLQDADLEHMVDYMLDDCFFSIGQSVGDRKKVDQSAVIWWRDRYRAKFLRMLRTFGNTWLQDRARVMVTVRMLGDRAVYHAGASPTIDFDCATKASKDIERYCTLHAIRRHRRTGEGSTGTGMFAGYYCTA
jgi:hypothetical protein